MSEENLDYYMHLPYTVEITPDEDGEGFNAEIPRLKGCMAFGESIEEAYEALVEVKQAWFEIALDRGWEIPEPVPGETREYSGRFSLRLPRSLHQELSELAEEEDTSLNQLVITLLAEGKEQPRQRPQPVRVHSGWEWYSLDTFVRRYVQEAKRSASGRPAYLGEWGFPSGKGVPIEIVDRSGSARKCEWGVRDDAGRT